MPYPPTMRFPFLASVLLLALRCFAGEKPNIVFILADDLGYGDIGALNPEHGKIATPRLDALAAGGLVYTDAHSPSSVCTPTRYGIMTGRYNWRSRLQSGVLNGYAPPLIEKGRVTMASMLKGAGYDTACIGKWHLGLDWAKLPEGAKTTLPGPHIDYTKPFANGPVTLGFDTFHGIAASLDMPPFVWLIDDRVETPPTVVKKFKRSGAASVDFEAEEILPRIARESASYIGNHAASSKAGKPFFLCVTLTSPHTPLLPTKEWRGKSGLGDYGDFVMATDAVAGDIVDALKRNGLEKNTLVVFTSDNGCAPYIGVKELEAKGHFPSADRRGYKADIFDGGHRIPLIAYRPGTVPAGTKNTGIVCLTDWMRTFAELTGAKLPDDAAEDSISLLNTLDGKSPSPRREVVVHSIDGMFAVIEDGWKAEFTPGSGGWSDPKPKSPEAAALPPLQLYRRTSDVAETTNVAAQHREIAARLLKKLEDQIASGRSTPGPTVPNTAKKIVIWKDAPEEKAAVFLKKSDAR